MFLCRVIQWNIFLFDNRRTLHKYVMNIFPVSKKLDEDLMKYYLLPDYDNKVLLWLMKTFHPEEQLILIYRLVFPNFYYFQTMKDLCLVLDSDCFPHLCSHHSHHGTLSQQQQSVRIVLLLLLVPCCVHTTSAAEAGRNSAAVTMQSFSC